MRISGVGSNLYVIEVNYGGPTDFIKKTLVRIFSLFHKKKILQNFIPLTFSYLPNKTKYIYIFISVNNVVTLVILQQYKSRRFKNVSVSTYFFQNFLYSKIDRERRRTDCCCQGQLEIARDIQRLRENANEIETKSIRVDNIYKYIYQKNRQQCIFPRKSDATLGDRCYLVGCPGEQMNSHTLYEDLDQMFVKRKYRLAGVVNSIYMLTTIKNVYRNNDRLTVECM